MGGPTVTEGGLFQRPRSSGEPAPSFFMGKPPVKKPLNIQGGKRAPSKDIANGKVAAPPEVVDGFPNHPLQPEGNVGITVNAPTEAEQSMQIPLGQEHISPVRPPTDLQTRKVPIESANHAPKNNVSHSRPGSRGRIQYDQQRPRAQAQSRQTPNNAVPLSAMMLESLPQLVENERAKLLAEHNTKATQARKRYRDSEEMCSQLKLQLKESDQRIATMRQEMALKDAQVARTQGQCVEFQEKMGELLTAQNVLRQALDSMKGKVEAFEQAHDPGLFQKALDETRAKQAETESRQTNVIVTQQRANSELKNELQSTQQAKEDIEQRLQEKTDMLARQEERTKALETQLAAATGMAGDIKSVVEKCYNTSIDGISGVKNYMARLLTDENGSSMIEVVLDKLKSTTLGQESTRAVLKDLEAKISNVESKLAQRIDESGASLQDIFSSNNTLVSDMRQIFKDLEATVDSLEQIKDYAESAKIKDLAATKTRLEAELESKVTASRASAAQLDKLRKRLKIAEEETSKQEEKLGEQGQLLEVAIRRAESAEKELHDSRVRQAVIPSAKNPLTNSNPLLGSPGEGSNFGFSETSQEIGAIPYDGPVVGNDNAFRVPAMPPKTKAVKPWGATKKGKARAVVPETSPRVLRGRPLSASVQEAQKNNGASMTFRGPDIPVTDSSDPLHAAISSGQVLTLSGKRQRPSESAARTGASKKAKR